MGNLKRKYKHCKKIANKRWHSEDANMLDYQVEEIVENVRNQGVQTSDKEFCSIGCQCSYASSDVAVEAKPETKDFYGQATIIDLKPFLKERGISSRTVEVQANIKDPELICQVVLKFSRYISKICVHNVDTKIYFFQKSL
jgi:hypothetical protein